MYYGSLGDLRVVKAHGRRPEKAGPVIFFPERPAGRPGKPKFGYNSKYSPPAPRGGAAARPFKDKSGAPAPVHVDDGQLWIVDTDMHALSPPRIFAFDLA